MIVINVKNSFGGKMEMKKFAAILLSASLLTMLFSGCRQKISKTGTDRFPDFCIALAVGEGGIDDGSYNQSAHEAILEFQRQTGASYTNTISPKQSAYYGGISFLADEKKHDVIWCLGNLMQEPVLKAAENYPDQLFAIMDANIDENDVPKNVIVVNVAAEQSALLSGYIAGNVTKTNSLGFVKGMECPSNDAFEYGFRAGAYIAQKQLGKEITVTKKCINSFSDKEAAFEATEELINQNNTDIIHQCAGLAGIGSIEKCKEAGIYAIGVDKDQSSIAPGTVLTSSVKHVGSAIYSISTSIAKREIAGGTSIYLGMDTGHTGISATSDQTVPKEILGKAKVIEGKIIDKSLKAPSNQDEFQEFKTFVDNNF